MESRLLAFSESGSMSYVFAIMLVLVFLLTLLFIIICMRYYEERSGREPRWIIPVVHQYSQSLFWAVLTSFILWMWFGRTESWWWQLPVGTAVAFIPVRILSGAWCRAETNKEGG